MAASSIGASLVTVSPPVARSTSTSLTPATWLTSSATEPTQWPQVMPTTVKLDVLIGGFLSDSSVRAPLGSGAHEAGDRLGGLADLLVGLAATGLGGLDDAVRQVLLDQAEGDRLQRLRHRRDLREDVDAVLLVLDHPLQAADRKSVVYGKSVDLGGRRIIK